MKTQTGVVRYWNRLKGWGFVVPDSLEDDIFIHRSALVGRLYLREEQRVSYTVGTFNGKPCARIVVVTEEAPTPVVKS
jgi:cold shock protein